MFHRFREAEAPPAWQGALTAAEFEAILRFVGPERVLSPSEWIARLDEQALRPSDLCVTFDDGLRCQVEQALPVLDAYGIKAFWFVYSCVWHGQPVRSEVYSYAASRSGGFAAMVDALFERCPSALRSRLESNDFRTYAAAIRKVAPFYSASDISFRFLRNDETTRDTFEAVMDGLVEDLGFPIAAVSERLWLRADDLRELAARGHHVGLHSYDHPYAMGSLPAERQRWQYERNAGDIVAATGRRPMSMSHPLDSYDDRTLAVLADLGVRCGFRANMSGTVAPNWEASALTLPREDSTVLLELSAAHA